MKKKNNLADFFVQLVNIRRRKGDKVIKIGTAPKVYYAAFESGLRLSLFK